MENEERTTFGAIIERRPPPPPPFKSATDNTSRDTVPVTSTGGLQVTPPTKHSFSTSDLAGSRPGTAAGIRPHYLHLQRNSGVLDAPLPSPFDHPAEEESIGHHSRSGSTTTAAESEREAQIHALRYNTTHHHHHHHRNSDVSSEVSEADTYDADIEAGHLESIRGPHTSNTTISRPQILTRHPSPAIESASTPAQNSQTGSLPALKSAVILHTFASAPAVPTGQTFSGAPLPSLTRAATVSGPLSPGTSMWPTAQERAQKEKAAKKARSNPLARLSKRNRAIVSLVIGLLVVGTAIGVGVGVSRAYHGEVWAGNGMNRPIDSP